MKETFNEAFELVVGHEGGFGNDRHDRGNWTSGTIGVGKLSGTKYGISAMAYPDLDIRNLTLQDAKDIYRRDYWNKCRCDDLPFPLDYITFDAAANHGNSRSVRFLQAAVGASVDGVIGAETVGKALAVLDLSKATTTFCVTRALFYTDIGTFQRYKNGWFRRLFEVHAVAVSGLMQAIEDGETRVVAGSFLESAPKAAVDTPFDDEELSFWVDFHKTAKEAAERAERLSNGGGAR